MTEDTFRDLFATHFSDVWRFVRRRVASDADADDITAEIFSVAWRRQEQLPTGAERPWLFRTAHNVLANFRRGVERQRRLHRKLVAVDPPAQAYEAALEADQVLWPALAALAPDDQELLLMRAWDGLDVNEIASVLQLEGATVSSRLYKARQRLRREFDRRDGVGGGHVRSESHGRGRFEV